MTIYSEEAFVEIVKHCANTTWQPIETAPTDDTEVLTWDGISVRIAAHCWEDRWQVWGLPSHKPTHWMPLPAPPEAA